jgi:hypothetical protein
LRPIKEVQIRKPWPEKQIRNSSLCCQEFKNVRFSLFLHETQKDQLRSWGSLKVQRDAQG